MPVIHREHKNGTPDVDAYPVCRCFTSLPRNLLPLHPASPPPLPFLADVRLASLEERHRTDRPRNADDVHWGHDLVQTSASRAVMTLANDGVDALVVIAEDGVDVDLVAHAGCLAHADDQEHLA